jgi:hypothetical protein
MATNNAAKQFAKKLFAAFSRYPISADTKELYTDKLCKWKMTQPQWDASLDLLIEKHEDENLPGLAEVYKYLKQAEYSTTSKGDDRAWLTFDLEGYSRAMRCRNDQGIWVIADLVSHDVHGQEIHHHRHGGEPAAKYIPGNATNVMVSPDKLAPPNPEDMPTREEVRDLVSQTVLMLLRSNAA